MIKGKRIKKMAALMAACGMLSATNLVAFAGSAWDQASGKAGSTGVIAEVGFNGKTAYAKVRATDYVDVSMYGTVYCIGVSGYVVLSGAFTQGTYGEAWRACDEDVYQADCLFHVLSADGEWSFYGYAH